MYKYNLLLFFVFNSLLISAQNFDVLVQKVWAKNHMLQAKNFQLKSAEKSFLEAKANFGPSVSLGIQYSLAEGGRSISVPVGDLLNPVYSTLNQITNSQIFPQISNSSEMFLPNNFYDARFRISQVIYYPDLSINKKLKSKLVDMKALEIISFKRLLSKEIMLSTLNWNAAQSAIKIYIASDSLLNEAIRTSNSLIRNGVALPSGLLRLEDQLSESKVQQAALTAQIQNIKDYLDYLTGDSLTEKELENVLSILYPPVDEQLSTVREEIKQIELGIQMQNIAKLKEKKFYHPKIGVQLDLGSQEFDFGFSPYALMGLNIELPLYDHKKHQFRSQLASAEIESLNEQKEATAELLNLQSKSSKRNLQTAIQQAMSYERRISTSSRLYQEVFAKYKQGTANYLELLDAQNQWTQSRLQHSIAVNTAWVKWAEYVYANATYPIQ